MIQQYLHNLKNQGGRFALSMLISAALTACGSGSVGDGSTDGPGTMAPPVNNSSSSEVHQESGGFRSSDNGFSATSSSEDSSLPGSSSHANSSATNPPVSSVGYEASSFSSSTPTNSSTYSSVAHSESSGFSSSHNSVSSSSSSSSTPAIESSSVSSASSVAVKEPLDCLKLDPDKVYMIGTYQEDERLYALTDPLDPTAICAGLPDDYIYHGMVSDLGHFVYGNSSYPEKHIRIMYPDELEKTPEGIWDYPSFTTDNDMLLYSSTIEGCALATIKLASESENVYYSCPHDTINTELAAPYYDLGNTSGNALLSVLSDGSMLVSKVIYPYKELILVGPSLNETILSLPISDEDADIVFGAVKQYVHPVTGNESIWVQLIYHEESIYQNNEDTKIARLSIDLTTLKVVNEGLFSKFPEGTRFKKFVGAFDGSGNLWQFGQSVVDVNDDVVVKRPLKSSGKSSITVYRESEYRNQEIYIGPVQSCDEASFDDWVSGNCDNGTYNWRHYDVLFLKIDWFSHFITGN